MKTGSDPLSRYVVALTGGVAAGKSAVARRFRALDVGVYDADVAAREVVAAGEPALADIVRAFGGEALNRDGSLDRPAMRARVFADPAARKRLEAIIHPRVREWLRRHVEADRGVYCVLAIPLLAENWRDYDWVDRVLVVDAPDAVQLERLTRRDGITTNAARHMLAAQATRDERLAIADDVILNDGEEAALDAKVAALHARYVQFATAMRR